MIRIVRDYVCQYTVSEMEHLLAQARSGACLS